MRKEIDLKENQKKINRLVLNSTVVTWLFLVQALGFVFDILSMTSGIFSGVCIYLYLQKIKNNFSHNFLIFFSLLSLNLIFFPLTYTLQSIPLYTLFPFLFFYFEKIYYQKKNKLSKNKYLYLTYLFLFTAIHSFILNIYLRWTLMDLLFPGYKYILLAWGFWVFNLLFFFLIFFFFLFYIVLIKFFYKINANYFNQLLKYNLPKLK